MRSLWAVILLLAAGLGGCSDAAPEEAPGLSVDDEVVVTSTTGAIRGVVVNDAIQPLEGADIVLMGQDKSTKSNAAGEFAFSDLEPGNYFLKVSKVGYEAVQQSAAVEAGVQKPPIVRVLLAAAPGTEPTSFERTWEGIIQCSLRFVVNAIALCSVASTLGDDFTERYTDLEIPPSFAQSEMVWKNTQPVGESLKLQYTDDSSGLDNYRIHMGPSPLMINVDRETLETKNFGSVGLYVRVFTGDYQGTGLSLTLQQRFTTYTSFFYNYAPPEGWMFIEDGAYPPPS